MHIHYYQYPLNDFTTETREGSCHQVGWQIMNRQGPDVGGHTMVAVDKTFGCPGKITSWRYQAKFSNPLRAIVWRPMPRTSTQFKIVGINDIPAGRVNMPDAYTVPQTEQITVQPGDVIGWSFRAPSLTFNEGANTRVLYLRGHISSYLKENQIRYINQGFYKREYSIEAVVAKISSEDVVSNADDKTPEITTANDAAVTNTNTEVPKTSKEGNNHLYFLTSFLSVKCL